MSEQPRPALVEAPARRRLVDVLASDSSAVGPGVDAVRLIAGALGPAVEVRGVLLGPPDPGGPAEDADAWPIGEDGPTAAPDDVGGVADVLVAVPADASDRRLLEEGLARAGVAGTPVLVVLDDPTPDIWSRVRSQPSADLSGTTAEEIALRVDRLVAASALRRSLRDAEDAAEAARRELERFAYVASHDLKEPLRAVTGFASLLQARHADQLHGPAQTYLHYIVDGAERLASMVEALRDHARLSRHEVVEGEVDLAGVVADVVADLPPGRTDGVDLRVGPLPVVWTDRELIRAVLAALVDNATLFRGSPDLPHRVAVAGHVAGARVVITVSDTGIGIDPQDQDRVVDIFTRLHGRERYPGHGVGLAIASVAVGRLGGRMTIDSEPGRGTTVTVDLPLAVPPRRLHGVAGS